LVRYRKEIEKYLQLNLNYRGDTIQMLCNGSHVFINGGKGMLIYWGAKFYKKLFDENVLFK